MAVDDHLNPLNLGVTEAANCFFATPGALVPFTFVRNKLFLCRPFAEELRKVLEAAVVSDAKDPRSIRFMKGAQEDRNRVDARVGAHLSQRVLAGICEAQFLD